MIRLNRFAVCLQSAMRAITQRVLLSAGLMLAIQVPAAAGWKVAELGRGGDYCSVAVDANGNPHISYLDGSNPSNHVLRYATSNGKAWRRQIVDSGDVGWYSSIALDSLGRPRIAYHADGQPSGLKYAAFDGTIWTTTVVDDGGYSNDIAIDANDHPHISYAGGMNGDIARYARFDGSNWIIEEISNNILYFGRSSIALEPSGTAHVSFSDMNLPRGLHWATNGSGSWVVSGVDSGILSALALDSVQRPRLFYLSESPRETRYAAWTGASWDFQSLPPGDSPGLAIDAYDRPHISLGLDISGYSAFAYAMDDGNGFEGIVLANLNTGFFTSVAVDPSGLPHVVGSRVAGVYGGTRLLYARRRLPDLTGSWQTISRTQVIATDRIAATLEVANGGNSASRPCGVQVYLSDDAVFDPGDIPLGRRKPLGAVGPGKSRMVSFSFELPSPASGKHLIAVVDSAEVSQEILEGNNAADGVIP